MSILVLLALNLPALSLPSGVDSGAWTIKEKAKAYFVKVGKGDARFAILAWDYDLLNLGKASFEDCGNLSARDTGDTVRVSMLCRFAQSSRGRGGYPLSLSARDYSSYYNVPIVLSGGYMTSFSPPKALGFVRIGGQQLNASHNSWLGAGVLCVGGDAMEIRDFDRSDAPTLPDCIQSGPVFIKDGKSRYAADENISAGERKLARSVQEQAFACIAGDGSYILGVTDPVRLEEFAVFLIGKGCTTAIRLTGQDTASMVVEAEEYGPGELPLHNVLAIWPAGAGK